VDLDRQVDLVEAHEAIAEGARHARVDLRDHQTGRTDRGHGRIDRGPERTVAVRVRWRDVDQRDVERQAAAGEQLWNVGQEDRYEVRPPLIDCLANIGPNEQCTVPQVASHSRVDVWRRPGSVQVDDLDVL